jgi:TolB-like protein/tRNA A-37 threonylcarbamoyl transferase component Bud32
MSFEPLRLDALLESVADGSDVDWDAAEAAADEDQRRIVRNLRLVARIAEVHRTMPDRVPDAGAPDPLLPTVPTPQSIPHWGRLLLLETIGEGAFGEVHRARDPWLDRDVALKLLKSNIAGPGRLLAEAQALARVRHPNVVTVHGADIQDGRVGLWMELVRGRTLAAIVASDGPFSGAEAAVIGQEVSKAVSAVHAAGLVHRDIKAQNVMRESGGRLVLMDFSAGHTPLYAAPELLNGGQATVATDVYALGVLLYFLVVGKYPLNASSSDELKQAHARGERKRLAEVRPDLPASFIAAVERAMDPDPSQRYASAWDIIAALEPAQRRFRGTWPVAAAVAAAVGAGVAYHLSGSLGSPTAHAAVTQVAVLPLQALSGTDPFVASGLTEAVTQELSMSGPLRVVSRTSVDRAASDRTPLPELARALHADAVIEGSVSRGDSEVSVNIRVIHAGSNTAVWAQTFERPIAEASIIQRDIARALAAQFQLAIDDGVAERWQTARQVNPAAYEEYMRGRHEFRRGSQPGLTGAVTHFERAIAMEPRYARAHASLAQAYFGHERLGLMPRDEARRRARAAVDQALQIDSSLPDAQALLARFEADEMKVRDADARFRRAIDLDPSFVEPRLGFALFLAGQRRFDEAFAQLVAARNVDPLSVDVAGRTATVYYYARRYREALAEIQRAIKLDPDHVPSQIGLARILNASGRHDEALRQAERTAPAGGHHPLFEVEMALADVGAGRVASARRRISGLTSRASQPLPRISAMALAVAWAPLDRDQAFRWLQREFEGRSGSLLWVRVDPRLDPLRTDRRFQELLERLQLEP